VSPADGITRERKSRRDMQKGAMNMRKGIINFAPGVVFDADLHKYWKDGRELSGITRLLGTVGEKGEGFLTEHQIEGIHVHKAVQAYLETGNVETSHPGVQWVIKELDRKWPPCDYGRYSEVLVSDGKRYASAVDVIIETPDGGLVLLDLKKGVFKREYATFQLNIYRYFIERFKRSISGMWCVGVKDRRFYPILTKSDREIEGILYKQKEKMLYKV
jgi:hypothetical protein